MEGERLGKVRARSLGTSAEQAACKSLEPITARDLAPLTKWILQFFDSLFQKPVHSFLPFNQSRASSLFREQQSSQFPMPPFPFSHVIETGITG